MEDEDQNAAKAGPDHKEERVYTFWVPFEGRGFNPQDAWNDGFSSIVFSKEWLKPPEDIFGEDDEIPSAEILGGSLSAGFGIDNGKASEE